jgi:hypothetical protein
MMGNHPGARYQWQIRLLSVEGPVSLAGERVTTSSIIRAVGEVAGASTEEGDVEQKHGRQTG